MNIEKAKEKVLVWDIAIRFFHLGLITLLGVSWWTGNEGGIYLEYHFWSGYCLLALIIFRVIWGFIGSTTARFHYFIRTPRSAILFLNDLFTRKGYEGASHNPIGSYMVLLLILILLIQISTGFFSDDEIFNEGPFRHYVSSEVAGKATDLHSLGFDILLVLCLIHIIAVIWHEIAKGERLILAMITGRKRFSNSIPRLFFAPPSRMIISFMISIIIVWAIVTLS